MTQLKKQPTFFLSGYVYADHWSPYGAVTSLSVIAENNKEYRIFPDEVSNGLKKCKWDFLEMEYVLLDHIRFGPWIKIIDYTIKPEPFKEVSTNAVFTSTRWEEDNLFEQDFQKFVDRKNYDESEWHDRDLFYSLDREI